MDTKALRQKILDLAIRGKLVPQDPNDEPASVLLERIRAQKRQMVKDGKLKEKDIKNDTVIFVGEDNFHYERFADGTVKCIEDEIPFEIPKGWEWCRLSNIGVTNIGLTYSPADISKDGVMVLRSSNIVDGKIDLHDLIRVKAPIRHNQFMQDGDILLCARNGSKRLIGKCAIFKDIPEQASFGAFMAIFRSKFNQFIYYFFNTDTFRSTFCSDDTKQINQLTQDIIKRTLLPLPPQAEQIRIIAQLNRFFPVLENIEKEKRQTQLLIDTIKSRILDLAIRGKLVPQDPNDEPASVLLERIRAEKEELIKQGKIKRDKKDSIIFKGDDNFYYEKIPDGWAVCSLEEVIDYEQPTDYLVSSTDYHPNFNTPVLTAGKSFILGYTNESKGIFENVPVIIFDDFTTESKYVDFPFKAKSSAMKILKPNNALVLTKYAYYLMQTLEIDHENHQRYWISTVSKKKILLPPLAEQTKIVKRIEVCFAMLDDMI